MTETLFSERRKMLPTLFRVIIPLIMCSMAAFLILAYTGTIPAKDAAPPLPVMIIIVAILVLFALLALFLTLTVTVTDEAVLIRTIGTRTINANDIASVSLCDDVKAVRDYGGWGVRDRSKKRGYLVPGIRGGAEIRLSDGRTVLVCSEDPQKLCDSVKRIMPSSEA